MLWWLAEMIERWQIVFVGIAIICSLGCIFSGLGWLINSSDRDIEAVKTATYFFRRFFLGLVLSTIILTCTPSDTALNAMRCVHEEIQCKADIPGER